MKQRTVTQTGGDRRVAKTPSMKVAWRFSTAVCGHADDAEDAMQEALIKTYRYVGRIREPAAFRPWLYRTDVMSRAAEPMKALRPGDERRPAVARTSSVEKEGR